MLIREPKFNQLMSDIKDQSPTLKISCLIDSYKHEFYKKMLGQGGSKTAYQMTDNKSVILLPNYDTGLTRDLWERIISEEVKISEKLRSVGLKALKYEACTIEYDGYTLKGLLAPSFTVFEKDHCFVMEPKNPKRSIPYFNTKENLKDSTYLKKLFKDIIKNIVILCANDINLLALDNFKYDGLNFLVQPIPDECPRIEMFFFDFSSKRCRNVLASLEFIKDGEIIEDQLRKRIEAYLNACFSQFKATLSYKESELLLGKGHSYYDLEKPIDENFKKIKAEIIDEIASQVKNILKIKYKNKPADSFDVIPLELKKYSSHKKISSTLVAPKDLQEDVSKAKTTDKDGGKFEDKALPASKISHEIIEYAKFYNKPATNLTIMFRLDTVRTLGPESKKVSIEDFIIYSAKSFKEFTDTHQEIVRRIVNAGLPHGEYTGSIESQWKVEMSGMIEGVKIERTFTDIESMESILKDGAQPSKKMQL